MKSNRIVLYDGECGFCGIFVEFLRKVNYKNKLQLHPIQSAAGKSLSQQYSINNRIMDSVIFIERNKSYHYSAACIRILYSLGGLWKLIFILIIIPVPFRDGIYKFISLNRYRFNFKKRNMQNKCTLPM